MGLLKDLGEFFRANPALLTAIAALLSAVAALLSASASRTSARIAKSQRELAERQYELQSQHQELETIRAKREIYDRQISVYQAVKVLLNKFETSGVSKQDANTFFQCRAEADFLFRGEEIPEYLKQMSINAQLLAFYSEKVQDTDTLPVGEARTQYVNEETKLITWFSMQGPIAREKFKPYLDISTPTTMLTTTL